jgi:hypothetical protein
MSKGVSVNTMPCSDGVNIFVCHDTPIEGVVMDILAIDIA